VLNARKSARDKLSFIKKGLGIFLATALLVGLLPASTIAIDSNVNVKVCYPAPNPPPTISSPADGTTTEDSSVLMTGQALPGVTVYAHRNSVQVGFVTSGGDGSFVISISLDMGTNVLKASTNDDCDDPAFSSPVSVEREAATPPPGPDDGIDSDEEPVTVPDDTATQPPIETPPAGQPDEKKPGTGKRPDAGSRPVILEPRHGARVPDPDIRVVGLASAHTTVRLLQNGRIVAEVLTDAEGRFTVGITLQPGENRLVATTGQGANTRSSETVVVTYQPAGVRKPAPSWIVPVAFAGIGITVTLYILFAKLGFFTDPTQIFKHWKGKGPK